MTVFGTTLAAVAIGVRDKYGEAASKTDDISAAIRKAAVDATKRIMRLANDRIKERFADPIVDMVAMLPMDEIANLAEALVGITALQRHVSSDFESVGGKIDVALISKSDGFIWIKRKHYFRPELNPQFSLNYMNDVKGETNDTRSSAAKTTGVGGGGRRGRASGK